MTELARLRADAWADLLAQTETLPTCPRRDAPPPARQDAAVDLRARSARVACRGARLSLASLRHSAALGRVLTGQGLS